MTWLYKLINIFLVIYNENIPPIRNSILTVVFLPYPKKEKKKEKKSLIKVHNLPVTHSHLQCLGMMLNWPILYIYMSITHLPMFYPCSTCSTHVLLMFYLFSTYFLPATKACQIQGLLYFQKACKGWLPAWVLVFHVVKPWRIICTVR